MVKQVSNELNKFTGILTEYMKIVEAESPALQKFGKGMDAAIVAALRQSAQSQPSTKIGTTMPVQQLQTSTQTQQSKISTTNLAPGIEMDPTAPPSVPNDPNTIALTLTSDQKQRLANYVSKQEGIPIRPEYQKYYRSNNEWYTEIGDLLQDPVINSSLNQFVQQAQQKTNTTPTTQTAQSQPTASTQATKLTAQPTQQSANQSTRQVPSANANNVSNQAIAKVDEIYRLYTANNSKPPTEILSLLAEIRRKFQSQSTQPTKESQEFQRIINLAGLK